ncbi:MAG: hypothetical protein Q4F95_13395 [Oscillospiraceae bacterium]|nr:hypothetical protein [Oscillospiraceae bacterium]
MTVGICTAEYNKRFDEKDNLKVPDKDCMDDSAMVGKIAFGVNYGEKKADTVQAEENALQSFEDGLYRIFLDNDELCGLDTNIILTEQSVITFVRLTMLSGRLW